MRRTIILVFTAAALLMAGAVTLDQHGSDTYKYHMEAAGYPPPYSIEYIHPLLESWERVADMVWLLALGVLVAGIKLSADEPRPPHRVSLLGLHAVAQRRVVRAATPVESAAAVPLPRPHDDGLTPLERVIRGY